jgi:subtilisin
MKKKTAHDDKAPAAKRSGRILAVIDPKLREEFLANAREILGGELVYASEIEGSGDFMKRTQGLNVYFPNLHIVSVADALTDRARKFFTVVAPDQIRRSSASPSYKALGTPPSPSQDPSPSQEPSPSKVPSPSQDESQARSLSQPQSASSPTPPPAPQAPQAAQAPQCYADDDQSSWGIKATQHAFGMKGEGVKVGLLDSGMDFDHETFRGRAAGFPRRSFVTTPAEYDEYGHGTACASIICGLPEIPSGRKIGIAPAVELVVAKIFDVEEESEDTRTLAALDWALSMGCSIISMSIGQPVDASNGPDVLFEAAAEAATRINKAVLIAGAGNDSLRSGSIKAVNHPANCPSVVAVAAVDECLKVANFSNGQVPPKGGEINLAAPGVMVRVARQRAQVNRYIFRNGTSFAVPFVAGTAALWLQAFPSMGGAPLRAKLKESAMSLSAQLPTDVGDGLVRGP